MPPQTLLAWLAEMVRPAQGQGPVLAHIIDLSLAGLFDEDWVPLFLRTKCTIISADGGRQPNKNRGRKMTQLCVELGITPIVLSPSVHPRKVQYKAKTLLSVWDQVVAIGADPLARGNRYMIDPSDAENPEVGRITQRYVRRSAPTPDQSSSSDPP